MRLGSFDIGTFEDLNNHFWNDGSDGTTGTATEFEDSGHVENYLNALEKVESRIRRRGRKRARRFKCQSKMFVEGNSILADDLRGGAHAG